MIKGKVKQELNLDNILAKITEYDIYRYYCGDFRLGKAFNSPMPGRKDDHPSFVIACSRGGFLYHVDYADQRFKGNCVNFLMQKEGIGNYHDALSRIDRDFGLGFLQKPLKEYKETVAQYEQPKIEKAPALIQVAYKPFTNEELRYWAQFYQDENSLHVHDVYSVSKLYINRKLMPRKKDDLIFGYRFGDYWKIYKPLAEKKSKWVSNVPIDWMSGLDKIKKGCKTAIVAKAKKDEMVIELVFPEVCSVQAENVVAINDENITYFQESCGDTVIAFDSDDPGVDSCKYYNQFGFGYINVPKSYKPIKDFADLARDKGLDEVVNVFKQKGLL